MAPTKNLRMLFKYSSSKHLFSDVDKIASTLSYLFRIYSTLLEVEQSFSDNELFLSSILAF